MRAIRLGFACNNACVFCAQGERRAPRGDVDVDGQLAAIQPGEQVAFTGGEPTLHEALPGWIRAAAARGAAGILVQTNGRRLAYLAYARALAQAPGEGGDPAPPLAFDLSLHGSTEAMHDYHTGVDGSFAQTRLGLRHARALRLPVGVTTVITRSNFRHLAEVVRLAHASGARALQLTPAQAFGRAARAADRVVPAPELVAPYLARAVVEAQRLGLPLSGAGGGGEAAETLGLFAGLGEVEGAAVAPVKPRTPGELPRRSLPMASLGRPAPAVHELRLATRRTGLELAAIFPGLFADQAGDGRDGPG